MITIHTHSVFSRHNTGFDHPERAERLDAAMEGVARAGLGDAIVRDAEAHPETDRIIHKVHSAEYARELEETVRAGSRYFHSLDNPISSATFSAARTAVSASLTAAQAMLDSKRSFVVARPPGHHAERLSAMGFCFFNTIACVAEWLREQPGIERVFIYDFDVHHGNGTQHLFEQRDDVYYASIHRYPFYPGTGAANEIGTGPGRGFTKNIPVASRRRRRRVPARYGRRDRPGHRRLPAQRHPPLFRIRRPPPRSPRRHERHRTGLRRDHTADGGMCGALVGGAGVLAAGGWIRPRRPGVERGRTRERAR